MDSRLQKLKVFLILSWNSTYMVVSLVWIQHPTAKIVPLNSLTWFTISLQNMAFWSKISTISIKLVSPMGIASISKICLYLLGNNPNGLHE